MSNDLSPQQIKRDEVLRGYAKVPGEALRFWKKLPQGEQVVVITYMTLYYDAAFAKLFKANADKAKRPDATIQITNDPQITDAYLRKHGFKLARNDGGTRVYVHPSGNEVWLIPKPKSSDGSSEGSVPQVAPQRPQPAHPDLMEAQQRISDHQPERDSLVEEARKIAAMKGTLSAAEHQRLVDDWYERQGKFAEEVQESQEALETMSDDTMTDDEKRQLKDAKEDLRHMKVDWPNPSGG